MSEKQYVGIRNGPAGDVEIRVVDGNAPARALEHRVHHSPTGMEWGYPGSGPADLARSICWDVLGREPHPRAYQEVKFKLVAEAPEEGFCIHERTVRKIMAEACSQTSADCTPEGAVMTEAELVEAFAEEFETE